MFAFSKRSHLGIKISEVGEASLIIQSDTEAIYHHGVKDSCTVIIGQSVLFFGGGRFIFNTGLPRQLSQLFIRGLRRIGTLPFQFSEGRCLAKGKQVFLGCDWYNEKSFYSSSNLIKFDKTHSLFGHIKGGIVNYNKTLLAIGGTNGGRGFAYFNAKAEGLEGHKWTEHKMSPVAGLTELYDFTTLSVESDVYIFGGKIYNETLLDTIVSKSMLKWNGTAWLHFEDSMQSGRRGHTTIIYAGSIYHIGGCIDDIEDEYMHARCSSPYRINHWTEQNGSELVYESEDDDPQSYIVPIFWSMTFENESTDGL